jgi:hypothetical protein
MAVRLLDTKYERVSFHGPYRAYAVRGVRVGVVGVVGGAEMPGTEVAGVVAMAGVGAVAGVGVGAEMPGVAGVGAGVDGVFAMADYFVLAILLIPTVGFVVVPLPQRPAHLRIVYSL